ncbi:hypothetical protein Q7P35_006389 [Cladosporium inversicolor]
MGFLERAMSTRGRHQRTRSTKVDEPMPQSNPSQFKHSAKRRSIFPGLSSNPPEPTRPRAATTSARASYNQSAASKAKSASQDDVVQPPNTSHYTSNHSFKCPSPALVNTKPKRTPPTSVAHLPTMPDSNASAFSLGPKSSSRTTPPTWNRAVTDPVLATTQRETLPKQTNTWENPIEGPQQRPTLRKQKSAWKSFGDLFRGKQTRQPIPDQFYKVQTPSEEAMGRSRRTAQDKVGVLDSPVASPAVKEERTVARVDSGRTSLVPTGAKNLNSALPPTPADAYPVRTSSRNPSNFFDPPPNEASTDPRRTPRLDINIPEAGFDRYSVMFEKLLEPKVPIIERRQSKRVSCQTSNSPVVGSETQPSSAGLQRSKTSPSLKRKPSLTIHIANSNYTVRSTQGQNAYKGPMAHRPRPPKRAMTAPSNPASPLPVPVEVKTPITARAVPLPESTTSSSSPRCSILSENSLPPTPNTAISLASSINTTIFGSPSSPPPEASAASIAKHISTKDDPSSPAPPIPSRSEERPQLMRNYPTGTERFNRQIVQVSVARQVSVSKARRRVADAVEVKQPLRPRVVELGKNRKSTLVMIESGDS